MYPLTGLRLLLPAIVPSWRFFDAVQASPRVDYALGSGEPAGDDAWQEYRPRVPVLTLGTMLRRMLWNPQWNESLYLVSLSERLVTATATQTLAHSERELLLRVARGLAAWQGPGDDRCLQIRLRFVSRAVASGRIESEVAYVSAPHALAELVQP